MASTYTWSDVITLVSPYTKNIPTSAVNTAVCDSLNSLIWKSYYWSWSVASLTSASGVLDLVDGQQDYGIGTTSGAGFYRLIRARITRTDVSPIVADEKDIVNWQSLAPSLDLSVDGLYGIRAIAYNPTSSQFRLDSAVSVPSGTSFRIDGEYQFAPTKVTTSATVIVFPDQYFDVAVSGLKWKYYQLGDDPRANDQRQEFFGMLEEMKRNEDLGDGPDNRFPDNPIGAMEFGNYGFYGAL